ncbi:MAG TPA: hypothetical protein VEI97_14530 [bacterium]|nr:hypothetical protein [bacterium]
MKRRRLVKGTTDGYLQVGGTWLVRSRRLTEGRDKGKPCWWVEVWHGESPTGETRYPDRNAAEAALRAPL